MVAVLWLWSWGRPRQAPTADAVSAEADQKDLARKRQLIDGGRRLAATYSAGGSGDDSFRKYLERTQSYAALRGHLSPAYLAKLNDSSVLYATEAGARYEPLVAWFLDDLDRLEREWKLA